MTKYIEPRSTDEQLLKFAVIDAVMRSDDLALISKLADILAAELPDELKEASTSNNDCKTNDLSIMPHSVPKARSLEEIVADQKKNGPPALFTTESDFGGDYDNELSLEEEMALLTK